MTRPCPWPLRKLLWHVALVLTATTIGMVGCGRATWSVRSPAIPKAPAGTSDTNRKPDQPVPEALSRQQALTAVRQLPVVMQYEQAVKSAGYTLFLQSEETPSRFIIRVGEERPDKVTITRWFLVNKSDRQVSEWKMSDGSRPSDWFPTIQQSCTPT